MDFFLGLVTGIVFCLFFTTVLILFRKPIEKGVMTLEKKIERIGMFETKGFIDMPLDEDEEARQAKIAENQQKGKVTKLSEL